MSRRFLHAIAPLLRIGIGTLFLIAATLKFTMITTTQHGPRGGVEAFAATIQRGGIIPDLIVFPIAYCIFCIEILIGLALFTHRAPRFWAGVASVVLFAMTLYLVSLQLVGRSSECGCLGRWDSSIPMSIGRNALLVLACAPTLLLHHSAGSPGSTRDC